MNRKQMLDLTRRELAHIPDWPQQQRALRMTFWNLRLNSLGKRAKYPDDPLAVMEAAIRMSQVEYPGQTFEYDRAFFEAESEARKAEVVVEQVPVATWATDLLLHRSGHADLLILPQRVREGRGEYPAADLLGIKALRAAGVRVDWAHPEQDRTFASEYSAEVAVDIGMFVAQALAQESVAEIAPWLLARVRQALTGRSESAPIVVEVDRVKVTGNRREIEGLRVTGRGEGVVDVVAALLRGDSPPK